MKDDPIVRTPTRDIDAEIRAWRPSVVYRPQYRTTCIPDAEFMRFKLEALRYKWRYQHMTPMLSDISRSYANGGWARWLAWALMFGGYFGLVLYRGGW